MVAPSVPLILIKDTTMAAPRRLNTIETVVDVGSPRVLKKSRSKISVIITAMKIIMISSKVNIAGTKIPLRATSIIPLEYTAPIKIPRLATIMIVLSEIAFEPMAEFKKLIASLLTPTTISATARIVRATSINK